MFPARSEPLGTSSGKRKFDPTEECIVASQQKKKKAANTRAKPREFHFVFLPKTTVFVPKGYQRSKLAKKGRVVKASSRRNMSTVEVHDTITSAFASFKLCSFVYLKCGQDNRLRALEESEMSGDRIFEVAGQGSIYITEVSLVYMCSALSHC